MNAPPILAPLRRRGDVVPGDLVVTATLVVLACAAVLLPVVDETPLRVPFGVLLVVFLPGYALVSALFPSASGPPGAAAPTPSRLDGVDRLLLAVASSLALTTLVGLVLSVTSWGFTMVPTALALGGLSLGCCLVAATRRARLPPDERFVPPSSRLADAARASFVHAPTRRRLLNALLVCGVVVAAGSVAYAAANPNPTEPFSEFYLLATDESADPTTQGYELVPGTEATFRVGITNHEQRTLDYTVVVVAQRLTRADGDAGATGTERVVAQTELDRFAFRVAADGTREFDHTVPATTDLGGSQRVAYLLYTETPPAFPSADTAYRHLFVTVDA